MRRMRASLRPRLSFGLPRGSNRSCPASFIWATAPVAPLVTGNPQIAAVGALGRPLHGSEMPALRSLRSVPSLMSTVIAPTSSASKPAAVSPRGPRRCRGAARPRGRRSRSAAVVQASGPSPSRPSRRERSSQETRSAVPLVPGVELRLHLPHARPAARAEYLERRALRDRAALGDHDDASRRPLPRGSRSWTTSRTAKPSSASPRRRWATSTVAPRSSSEVGSSAISSGAPWASADGDLHALQLAAGEGREEAVAEPVDPRSLASASVDRVAVAPGRPAEQARGAASGRSSAPRRR